MPEVDPTTPKEGKGKTTTPPSIERLEDLTEFPDVIPGNILVEMVFTSTSAETNAIFIDKTPEGKDNEHGRMFWFVNDGAKRLVILQIPSKTPGNQEYSTPGDTAYRTYDATTGEMINTTTE